MSNVPKIESSLDFCNILRKSIATAFVFYSDAKNLNALPDSSQVRCYLFLGDRGQKWALPFRLWNSEICCISRVNWWNELIFLHADTNLGKLNVNLIIIGWTWSEMGETF